jgi:hypothetical protein
LYNHYFKMYYILWKQKVVIYRKLRVFSFPHNFLLPYVVAHTINVVAGFHMETH